jgi:protein TonB
MVHTEPRLAWTTPVGVLAPESPPPRSRAGTREALWALGLSLLAHAALVAGGGAIMLAGRVPDQPMVLEIAAAPATPESKPETAAQTSSPDPAPKHEEPAPAPKHDEPPPAEAEKPAPPTERPPAPAAPRAQLAVRPPAEIRSHGTHGSSHGIETDMGKEAKLRPVVSPPVEYPRIAIQLREEGTVVLTVAVGADGVPGEISVFQSSGFGSLDQAAVQMMQHWRFAPLMRDGKAVATTTVIPVKFHLKHEGE